MKKYLSLGIVWSIAYLSATLSIPTYAQVIRTAEGGASGVGGGGDASEARVNEIRSDILKWINQGGAAGLKFNETTTLAQYEGQMKDILQAKKVLLGFVENNNSEDEELRVEVNGQPKTCRGFISRVDNQPHILCLISRFNQTGTADQYRLIHHEYAGLAGLEQNEGAASDYYLSNQITDFLKEERVLRLAVRQKMKREIKPCGLSGNLDERIKDCGYKRFSKISELYNKFIESRNVRWSKVMETADGAQVFYNNLRKTFWTNIVKSEVTFQEAETVCLKLGQEFGDLGFNWKLPSKKAVEQTMKDIGWDIENTFSGGWDKGFLWTSDRAAGEWVNRWVLFFNGDIISSSYMSVIPYHFKGEVKCIAK